MVAAAPLCLTDLIFFSAASSKCESANLHSNQLTPTAAPWLSINYLFNSTAKENLSRQHGGQDLVKPSTLCTIIILKLGLITNTGSAQLKLD